MNYADNRQTLYISICFFIFGVASVGVYTVVAVLINFIKKSFQFPEAISEYIKNRNWGYLKQRVKAILSPCDEKILQGEAFNFLFILALGVLTTLLNYVLLDGEFRIYTLLSFLAGVLISVIAFSKYIKSIANNTVGFIFKILLIFLTPVFSILSWSVFKVKKNNK